MKSLPDIDGITRGDDLTNELRPVSREGGTYQQSTSNPNQNDGVSVLDNSRPPSRSSLNSRGKGDIQSEVGSSRPHSRGNHHIDQSEVFRPKSRDNNNTDNNHPSNIPSQSQNEPIYENTNNITNIYINNFDQNHNVSNPQDSNSLER